MITISLGTNSLGANKGDFDTVMAVNWGVEGSDIDKTVVYGAMRWEIETLKRKFPKAIIILSTPIQRFFQNVVNMSAMNDAIRKIAFSYGCIVTDAYSESGSSIVIDSSIADQENRLYYLDGLHLTNQGAEMYSKYMAGKIESGLNT